MVKTASSAGSTSSSRDHQQSHSGSRMKYSHQQTSSSAPSSSTTTATVALPQCKVKRNYACSKCAYYTQNPRSFLHHQKNVHAERLKVYECAHCLYASKHSQKLQRHVQMVHRSTGGKANIRGYGYKKAENKKPPLVPPVRIRVQRSLETYADQQHGKLMIVGDVDAKDPRAEDMEKDIEEEKEEEEEEEEERLDENIDDREVEEGEEEVDEDEIEECSEEGSVDQDGSTVSAESPQIKKVASRKSLKPMSKKQYKLLEKQSTTFIRCSVCPFGSHSQTLVNRHEKTAHLKKKFFRCMKCNYVTHMRARYTKHVKYHTMPIIKCADCDFSTPYKWNLDRHNRNHSTNIKGTYKCSHCSFSADIKQSLTVHETNHHKPPRGGMSNSGGGMNRRRYRVGASDAPGSIVDGTEIVTYECTKGGGIVEIMTETTTGGNGSSSGVAIKSTANVVKKTTTLTTTPNTTAPSSPPPLSIFPAPQSNPTGDNKTPQRRRPMPQLIPLTDKKPQRPLPMIIPLQSSTSPSAGGDANNVATGRVDDDDNDNDEYLNVTAGRSALSDFASLIDEDDDNNGSLAADHGNPATAIATTADRRGSSSGSGSVGSSASPKSKTASFFDKLKARVDETADLTCSVCRYESKCLSEYMCHQRTHGDGGDNNDDDDDGDDGDDDAHRSVDKHPENAAAAVPLPPPVSAAALKSTRCQQCRKRCKTSAELVVHLATCRGTAAAGAVAVDSNPPPSVASNDDQDTQQQLHPMENRIFVWNTAAAVVSGPRDQDAGAAAADEQQQSSVTITPVEVSKLFDESAPVTDQGHEQASSVQSKRQLPPISVRKEGKIYKTVFKCPHCTFWAATASRFHVHIVGHLNRKPFECSCCAYRSNWRWDITKHIRLKSAKKGGGEESASAANTHQGAKVLMTDETGRRNYSKYNRYLTVMEMDIDEGADRTAGGDCEDGKGGTSKRTVSVGGGVTRKRRAMPITGKVQGKGQAGGGPVTQIKTVRITPGQQTKAAPKGQTPSKPSSVTDSDCDNRAKTFWKCKRCFFRDSDRQTVLDHIRRHYDDVDVYRRVSSQQSSSQFKGADDDATANKQSKVVTKKSTDSKEITDKKTSTIDHRKANPSDTGSTTDTLLLLSTNPKSLMLYDDENFLSCPLCDVACSPGELKMHIERTHIPEETKYRCEYCPFWSEEKKEMLDHMMFAHEFDNGSVNTDVNTSDINYRIGQRDESNSNSIIDYEDARENDERIMNESGSNDTSVNTEMFDNGNGDNTTIITNNEMVFGTNDENIIAETVECTLGFGDNDGDTNNTSNSFEKTNFNGSSSSDDQINDIMVSCEYSDGEEDDEITVKTTEASKSSVVNVITKTKTRESESVLEDTNDSPVNVTGQLFECSECWYFSTNKKVMSAHKQLHTKRGALYNCTQCDFNVTKSAILYNHYRYGHVIEEPELQYPEDSIVRAGYKEIITKNVEIKVEDKPSNVTAETEDTGGPPMVWCYNKSSVPPFSKVFKCRHCPHTNRRRHNTIDHERMHSDHPDHQNHRQQQQRTAGSSITQSPLHPCKRCTYVCNNAGVLASHTKVHSTAYGSATIGFYDGTTSDSLQQQALEYVIDLEQQLLMDKDCDILQPSGDNDNLDDSKYTEFDDPELKFCRCCPARFFFHFDLLCHTRFHKFHGWRHSCDYCSFTARSKSHVEAHEVVHCDEYAHRTDELISSGYPVSKQFPRPSEYPESVIGDSLLSSGKQSLSPPQSVEDDNKRDSLDSDGRPNRRPKRLRYSDGGAEPLSLPEKQEFVEKTTKLRRRSVSIGMTGNAANTKTPPTDQPIAVKTAVAMKTTGTAATKTIKTLNATTADALKTTSGTAVETISRSNYVKQFTCDLCPGRFFKLAALQYHKTLHGGPGQHQCRSCSYAVSTYGNLIRHEAIHQELPARGKVKSVTLYTPKSKDKAEKNVSPATTIKSTSPQPPPLVIKNADDDNDNGSSSSTQNEEFPLDPEFGTVMLGNPDFFYPTTVKNGVARSKRYKCPKCPTAFDKRDQFSVHLTLHGSQDKYQCDKCDYSVKYTANFVQHQRKHAHDAEIRKNYERAAERSQMIAAQEEASNTPRARKRSSVDDQLQLSMNLEPRETKFRNEISDRQTAYELNAAYGGPTSVVTDGSGETIALFRCTHCPYETNIHDHLGRHIVHHENTPIDRYSIAKYSWKRACRFCSYRTYGESDLTEHTRVHFLRSTSVILASLAAVTSNGKISDNELNDSRDHVEFHGKRIAYKQLRRENNGERKDYNASNSINPVNGEPFFVFKDRGTDHAIGTDEVEDDNTTDKPNRFIPEAKRPKLLIDINDNRTSSCAEKTSFVRFLNGGKRLQLLENRNEVDPSIEIEDNI